MKRKGNPVRAGAALALALGAALAYGALSGRIGRAMRDNNAPFARFGASARAFFHGAGGYFQGRTGLAAQNQKLESENASLRARMLRHEELERENAALRAEAGLSARKNGGVWAEVVSRGGAAGGWLHTVRIDKGERDGVARDAPVFNGEGLVGRVLSSTRRTADILLLSDPNCRVSCFVEREGVAAHGVLSGGGGGALRLDGVAKPLTVDYLGKDIEVLAGDRILTSGLGGVFPSGLPVGRVVSAAAAPSGLYKTARIAPFVDFRTVSRVFVRTDGGGGGDGG